MVTRIATGMVRSCELRIHWCHAMMLERMKPYWLAVRDIVVTNLVVVANNIAYPCPEGILHTTKMLLGRNRIFSNRSYSDHVGQKLLVPSLDIETTKVRQAICHYIMWLANSVVFKKTIGNLSLTQSSYFHIYFFVFATMFVVNTITFIGSQIGRRSTKHNQ